MPPPPDFLDIERGTESEIDNLLLVVAPFPQISEPSIAFAGHRLRYISCTGIHSFSQKMTI